MRLRSGLAALLVAAACDPETRSEPTDAGGDAARPRCAFGVCPAEPGPGWHVAHETTAGALVSVWGDPAGGAWAVGGSLGTEAPPLVLRFDGEAWSEQTLAGSRSLWWVWGAAADRVFFAGEGGSLARWDGSALRPDPSLTPADLFGVWGSGPDDVWAVGGTPAGEGPDDVVLRWDGRAWREVPVPDPKGITLFKVWGSGPEDVWICGERGWLLHFGPDGFTWHRAPTPTTLFTVTGGGPGEVWAVGGPPGLVLRRDPADGALVPIEGPRPANVLNGIALGPDGDVWVVGLAGVKWRARGGAWTDDSRAPPRRDLHAVWAGPGGVALAVGGDFLAPASAGLQRRGLVGVYLP